MPTTCRQVILKRRPMGEPKETDFELVEVPVPVPAEGQVLCRTVYLSLDPYMRGRTSEGPSYAEPVPLGGVMCGATVEQVVESRSPDLAPGDFVLGYAGWREWSVTGASHLRKLDPAAAPVSYALGTLGMPGMTAYVALLDIGRPKAGETVVISAAAGAVGSTAGQIAKIKGCRVVGIVGYDAKAEFITTELGFDAAVNYKTQPVRRALKKACPDGIDVYFESVGGAVFEAVLQLINVGARIPLVGMISQYNATEWPTGPSLLPVLVKRATIQGIIVSDHKDRQPEFLRDVGEWLREGRIKVRETVVAGLESAPRAFIGLFHGENIGKLVVKVGEEE